MELDKEDISNEQVDEPEPDEDSTNVESGYNNSEIADTLGVDERTVRRDASPAEDDSANAEPNKDVERTSQVDASPAEDDSANAETSLNERDDLQALIEGEPDCS